MNIDPKTLPEGTVVERTGNDYNSPKVGYILGHGMYSTTRDAAVALPADRYEVRRVFVPVPDGMSVEDAEKALAEHVAWVPLPDGPTKAHVGARVRQQWTEADCLGIREGVLTDADKQRSSAVIGYKHHLVIGNGTDWFIHPDDVPADPDAELIEAIVAKFSAKDPKRILNNADRINLARYALVVVREHEAGQR